MNQGQIGGSSQHEDDEGDHVQPGEHARQALVVAGQPAAACHPGEASLHDPTARQQDEAAPSGRGAARPSGGSLRDGLGQADDRQGDAVRLGRFGRALAGIALVDKGQLHLPAAGVLDRLRQLGHGGTVVGAGRGDVQGEQMAQRVHGQVQLGAARALVPVPAGARAALRRGAQGAAVQHRRRRLFRPSGRQAQHGAQVVRQQLEAARLQPAPGLLVDRRPRRQIVRHGAPGNAVLDQIAQAVEHLAQGMIALPGILAQQRQVGHHQRPFLIGHVGRIRFAGRHRPQNLGTPARSVHNSL